MRWEIMVSSVLDPSTRNTISKGITTREYFLLLKQNPKTFALPRIRERIETGCSCWGYKPPLTNATSSSPKRQHLMQAYWLKTARVEQKLLNWTDKPQHRWESFTSPQHLSPPTSSSFPLCYVTDNNETQKEFVPRSPALMYPFSPPRKPPSCNSSSLPLLKAPWSPVSTFSTGALLVTRGTWSSAGVSTCNLAPNRNPSVLSGTPRAVFRMPNKYINCFQFISLKSFCLITIHLEFVFLMVYGYCW